MHEIFDVWDEMHPAQAESEEEFSETGDYSDLEVVPRIPTIDLLPECIDYSARGPGDFVISGPLGAGRGPGRHFSTRAEAYRWGCQKYGKQRVGVLPEESEFRWGLLVRGVK